MESSSNKRRSQRLFLQVKVVLDGEQPNHSAFKEETHTIVVNAHGALVETTALLDQGQTVHMRNVHTGEQIECIVKLVTPATAGKFSTAFEFKTPNPDFWRISFPPEDWATRTSESKKTR